MAEPVRLFRLGISQHFSQCELVFLLLFPLLVRNDLWRRRDANSFPSQRLYRLHGAKPFYFLLLPGHCIHLAIACLP
jgi:hypothetical protein